MENPVVYYNSTSDEKASVTAGTSRSTTQLFDGNSNKKMNTRIGYASLIALVVVVIALVIALVVVATNKDSNDESDKGQTGSVDGYDLPVPDCSYAVSNLEKAKCVLDSYPLIDG